MTRITDRYDQILEETLREGVGSREPSELVWGRLEAYLRRRVQKRRWMARALVAVVLVFVAGITVPPLRAAIMRRVVTLWQGQMGQSPAEVRWAIPNEEEKPVPAASSALRDQIMPVASVGEARQLVGYEPAVLPDKAGTLTAVEVWLGTYTGLPENESRSVFVTYEVTGQTYQVITTALFRQTDGVWNYEPVPSLMILSGATEQPETRTVDLPGNQEALCLDEVLGEGGRTQTRCHRLVDGRQVIVVGADTVQVEALIKAVIIGPVTSPGG